MTTRGDERKDEVMRPTAPELFGYDDPMWGRLTIDKGALANKLGEATRAVYDAAMAGQYRNEGGFPIQSALSTILGGLSQVIDGLIDLTEQSGEQEGADR